MKINQVLVESTGATVAFAFGRFNPAHQGHIEVWRTVEQAGANWFIGTNATTLGPNDPLTFEQKSAWMTEIYPAIQGHIVAQTSVLTLAAYIFKKTRKNERATVAYITDAADWAWSGKLLNQYNGVEGAHGYYKFAQIIHEPSPRVSSATALRDAARADDRVAFYHASGTDPKSKVAGLTYFDTVKQAVEKYPLPVKRVKKVKEQGVAEGDVLPFKRPGLMQQLKKLVIPNKEKSPTKKQSPVYNPKEFRNDEPKEGVAEGSDTETNYDGNLLVSLIQNYTPQSYAGDQIKQDLSDPASLPFHLADVVGLIDEIFYESLENGSEGVVLPDEKQDLRFFYQAAKKSQKQGMAEEQQTVAKTWDQMTSQEKLSGVKGRTVWNEKTQRYYTVFDVPTKQETDEGWLKNTAAGLALGAAAIGGAQAGTSMDDPSWHSGQYASHVKSDQTIQKQTGSPSVNQKRISDVTGPNADGEYRITVTQNGKIASQYITKTPPPDWMMKEQDLDEASLATMRDYFAGDLNAQDPTTLAKQRTWFDKNKDKNGRPTVDKRFRSPEQFQLWLKQNKLKQISSANESTNDKGWSLTNKKQQ